MRCLDTQFCECGLIDKHIRATQICRVLLLQGWRCHVADGIEVTRTSQTTDSDRSSALTTAVTFACVAFLAFVVGGFTMYSGLFPAEALRGAFQGGRALYDQLRTNDPVKTDFWRPARTNARGVVQHDPQRAQQGLTLYTSGHDQRAMLIDMDGRVVHQWSLLYSRAWDKSGAVAKPRPDAFIYIEKAHVFPNGDLLALYTAIGDTPWGYGLVKMDKNSNVIWKYLANAHHDFTFDTEGNIFVLTHEFSKVNIPGFEHLLKIPRIDDFIVKLSPDGRPLKKVWLTGAFARSSSGRRLYFGPDNEMGDYLHTNSVHVLNKAVPSIPQSRPGQVLVSMREISTIALIDPESSTVVWASTGPWVRQHDAEFLPNGRLLLFDNEGDPSDFGSRVLEIDPATFKVKWSYGGRSDQPLDSTVRGSQSRLANGNTLIVESYAGRVLEVTRTGDIVWEFINPVRGGPQQDRIPIIHWVSRVVPRHDFTPGFLADLNLEERPSMTATHP
jgi:outer membrane protein assembly factor BamB